MADRQVQIEFAKIKLALVRLLQSSITIMEEVQDQNPTTWEQLQEMMMNAADSGDWNERMHNLVISLMSSLDALGVNVSIIQLASFLLGKPGGRVDQIYAGQSEGASPD